MSISTKKLEAALRVVAYFFEDRIQNQDGEVTNRLAYTQERILNSVCYGAAQSLDRTKHSTLPKAQDEVRQAMRAHRGDELSEITLSKKIDWLDRVNDQIAHLEAFLSAAIAIHESETGKPFTFGTRTPTSGVRQTDAMARGAAALGKHVAPSGDYNSGLESTEIEHGINEPTRVTDKSAAA